MKSPLVTENCRRTKTNPDQSSLISYSTTKSCVSSELKTQVKVACKVLCEMREDESSKLAMKFTQLRIVLATQSLLHKLQKYKSAKLQSYFWILKQEGKTFQTNIFVDLNQIKCIHPIIKDLSNNQIRQQISQDQYPENPTAQVIVLYHVLNKLVSQQQKYSFKRIRSQSNYCKGILQITNFIKQCHKRSQYLSIINIMRCNQNRKILKTSVLDQNYVIQPEENEEEEQSSIQQEEGMSIKEQLAIKFASTTILSSILNEKIKKHQFSLFFNLARGQFLNKQLSFSQTNEITQIYEQSFIELNPNRINIGTQRLCLILYGRLKDYFIEIKTYQQKNELKNVDTVNTLISNKNSELSDNDQYQDLYTQRILPSEYKQYEQENENELQIGESNNELKMSCSLQYITDMDDSTKDVEQKKQEGDEIQQPQSKVIQQKSKNYDLIKNAVKSYCNVEQRKQNFQETPKISQRDQCQIRDVVQENKKQVRKQFYIPCMIGICMTILIILILQ